MLLISVLTQRSLSTLLIIVADTKAFHPEPNLFDKEVDNPEVHALLPPASPGSEQQSNSILASPPLLPLRQVEPIPEPQQLELVPAYSSKRWS
jgi:hypothetical protein